MMRYRSGGDHGIAAIAVSKERERSGRRSTARDLVAGARNQRRGGSTSSDCFRAASARNVCDSSTTARKVRPASTRASEGGHQVDAKSLRRATPRYESSKAKFPQAYQRERIRSA